MLELIDLIERSSVTIHADLPDWLGEYPAASSWSVVSDFSVGDTGKQNDAYGSKYLAGVEAYPVGWLRRH